MNGKYIFVSKIEIVLHVEICIYLADNTLLCPDCTMELLDEAGFEEHRINYDHANREATNTYRKYNTILIIYLV